ncbi:hypothetical protein ANN_18572 [Periplaneta americana]|uniref:Platelet-derived growth factor (PDGF) family profile domain-containing protein n=1 Tax=Periplaneta americana TaxID=6978 RepID=A0ABQ8SQ58_PERAM|nr:hypothetical protein ANN_18572 [Periplaneta americana]
MALSCVSFLYVHLLVVIVTADRRFQGRGGRAQRTILQDSTLYKPDERKPQDPVQANRDNYFNGRREASSTFRNKKRDYLKKKLNKIERNSRNKNIRDLHKGIKEFKNEYQARVNMIMDENGDLLADTKLRKTNPRFARKLNEIGSVFELASLLASRDRRFCTNKTITNLQEVIERNNYTTIQKEEFLTNLNKQCTENMDTRRRYKIERIITQHDLTKMGVVSLEAKKMKCKPKKTAVELPEARYGYTYYPQCVALQRCSGCCNSDLLECKPT